MLGIVHRDLKPANLFLARRSDGTPLVKVLDFGISKASSLTDSGLAMTKTASMMGSPLYMSPEQMRSAKDVDARTDVWSLGIIMYELLGGRVPFNSDTLGGLMSMVMMESPPPLETLRPDLPRDVCALVGRCLDKNPAQRTQNVAEIAWALQPFAPPRAHPIVDRIASVLGAAPPAARVVSNAASTYVASQPSSAFATSQPTAPSVQTAPGWHATSGGPSAPKRSAAPLIAGLFAGVAVIAIVAGVGFKQFRKSSATSDSAATTSTVTQTATSLGPTPPPAATNAALATPTATMATVAAPVDTVAHAQLPASTHGSGHVPSIPSAKPTTTQAVATATVTATATATATVQKPGILDTSN